MPARAPTPADFSPNLHVELIPPSRGSARNVVLFLHGLGDTAAPFTQLARRLALPDVFAISVQAPTPLPFDMGGFHWGDDIEFNQATGMMDFDAGFRKATAVLVDVILRNVLIDKCGYEMRDVFLFGYGQGGMAALAAAVKVHDELGGGISVGGPLPSDVRNSSGDGMKKCKTPVLVLGGSSQTLITASALRKIKETCESVEYHQLKRPGDGMPTDGAEMLPIMRFFGRRLRAAAPAGAVEVR